MVLGTQWPRTLGPILWDFEKLLILLRSMVYKYNCEELLDNHCKLWILTPWPRQQLRERVDFYCTYQLFRHQTRSIIRFPQKIRQISMKFCTNLTQIISPIYVSTNLSFDIMHRSRSICKTSNVFYPAPGFIEQGHQTHKPNTIAQRSHNIDVASPVGAAVELGVVKVGKSFCLGGVKAPASRSIGTNRTWWYHGTAPCNNPG